MKNFLLKLLGCFLFAIALQSCSHDVYTVQELKAQYDDAFKSNVLNGDSIDPRQNWNASVMSTLNVTLSLDAGASYRVCVMTDNPLQNTSATLLSERTMTTGETAALHFAKPMALSRVYVAAINSKNRYDVYAVNMTDTVASVNIGGTEKTASSAKGRRKINSSNVSTNPSGYTLSFDDIGCPLFNQDDYYDITNIDASNYNKIDNFDNGSYYYVPEGKAVSGNVNFNKNGSKNKGVIYVLGTLELPDGYGLSNGRTIVIAEGGHLILDGSTTFSGGSRLINLGTVQSNNGEIILKSTYTNLNDTYVDFYNSGTVNIPEGGFVLTGTNSCLYNNSTINVKYVDVTKYVQFTNFGTLNATSTCKGDYTTDGQDYAASYFRLINGCHTTINAMGVYQLILCDNSRIDCPIGIYTGGPRRQTFSHMSYLLFGALSYLKVGDWHDYAGQFYGDYYSDCYSIFQITGNIQMDYYSYYQGYIFFDANFSYSNTINTSLVLFNSNYHQLFYTTVERSSSISIPAGDCTGSGYNSENPPAPTPAIAPTIYYYAFEDLGSVGDYDFNDVIVGVKYPVVVGNQVNAEIYLVAAGGTLATSVLYNGNKICDEVHQTFGVSTSTMVNTYSSTQYPEHLLSTLTNVGDDFDASNLPISIFVNGEVSTEISGNNSTGITPQMIKVPSPWKWAKETTNISDAYSTPGCSFGAWGSNYAANTSWYLYPIEDRVVQK